MATVMEIHDYHIIRWLVSPSTVRHLLYHIQPALTFNLRTSRLPTNHYLTHSRMTLTLTSATHSTSTLSTSPQHLISNSHGLAVKTKTGQARMPAADLPLRYWAQKVDHPVFGGMALEGQSCYLHISMDLSQQWARTWDFTNWGKDSMTSK